MLLLAHRSALLLEGIDPARPERGSWWMTPGGGVDDGETTESAAAREVFEETGLRLQPEQLGPVVASRVAEFGFDGRQFRQRESFFAVKVASFTPSAVGWEDHERRAVQRLHWWPVEELRGTDERVYPRELPDLLDAVLAGTITSPLHLAFDHE